MIEIDGSQGEGGGQIIRTSLALSAITGKSFRITNIRAGRRKPGLKNQHVTAVQAAARICNAICDGATLGSSKLTFEPNPICGGHYEFDLGTAGSTSLVAQTLVPALMLADQPSKIVLTGGTHNPMAPTFDFINASYLPQLTKAGPKFDFVLHEYGFFPAGGGKVEMDIRPSVKLNGFDLIERGRRISCEVIALVSALPRHIGEREVETICKKAGWPRNTGKIIVIENPKGPGNVVTIKVTFEEVTMMFTGFGLKGVTAEKVAKTVFHEASTFLKQDVPVEEYLADQLMLPMGLAAQQGHTSRFRTLSLSGHSQTHLDIIKLFLNISTDVKESGEGVSTVTIQPG